MPKENDTQQTTVKQRPEFKVGPLPGGIGVSVWLNQIDTKEGPRFVRSLTISPRRYQDAESGEWRNSESYRVTDVAVLLLALEKAQHYMLTTRLPGQTDDASAEAADEQEIPF